MFKFHKHALGIISAVVIVLAAIILWWPKPRPVVPPPRPSVSVRSDLSMMAPPPDWSALDAYQGTITRSEFERLVETVFTAGDGWREWIHIGDSEARIRTAGNDDGYRLEFAAVNRDVGQARYWRGAAGFPAHPVGRPLQGVHIAIDPGHIGGAWARMEERWLSVGGASPICEGDMTMTVAMLLKPRLEGLGARVSLVRDKAEPVTDLRPVDFLDQATRQLTMPDRAQRLAERWFYRTAEIRARAQRVNDEIRPDLVLALHFNADAWGDPENPKLSEQSHVHLLVNGGYGDDEMAMEDQRFEMLDKLLSQAHREEAALAGAIGRVFGEATGMPLFQYSEQAPYVRKVDGVPGVWARNLLANRLYRCPVVFLEPYVMNSKPDYPRMQAGDYSGLKKVAGKRQPSIFREYAEVVVAGLVRHFRDQRGAR